MNTSVVSKYPVAIFELIPASSNGANFVREDTINTPNPVVLVHPKNRVIQNESVKREPSKKDKKIFINVPTRYIYNQEIILKDDQDAQNIKPNPKTDKIVFINGLLTVPKDGGFVGLYNFMKEHAQNLSNPDRVETLSPVFREIKPAEDAHEDNFNDFLIVEAVGYIKALVTEQNGKYVYNEERIDAICPLFNVYAESPEQKVTALIAIAKTEPKSFLEKAKASEQTIAIEINHGIMLKVISIEKNTVVYADQAKKIKEFPGCKDDDAVKTALASYFGSIGGKEAYELFKAELQAAKSANTAKQ